MSNAKKKTARTKKSARAPRVKRTAGAKPHTIKVSESVAKRIRALLQQEFKAQGRSTNRMMAYCAYYDPPGICVCYGF